MAERDSFQNIASEWHESRMAEFSEKHQGTIMYRLKTYIFSRLGKTYIARLETRDIMEVVKPLEQRGYCETSRRVLQIINQVFRYAVITGRAGHNIAAALRGALKPRKTVHRAAVLETEKVGQLLRGIDAYEEYFLLICALKLALLVFRTTELRSAQWKEFDIEVKELRISAERMKMRRQHLVPLSRQAISIHRELPKYSGEGTYSSPSVRTKVRPISDATMLNALQCMDYQKHEMSVHGFRSIASTLLNELGYNRGWIEDAFSDVYKRELDLDARIAFKSAAKAFMRTYGFLGAILPYGSATGEKLSIFLTLLIFKLPSLQGDDLAEAILQAIDLNSYWAEKQTAIALKLEDEDAEVAPVPVDMSGGKPKLEMNKLTSILNRFDELFGYIVWEDVDNVCRQIAEVSAMGAKDEVYQNAMKNSGRQNARLESKRALNAVMFKIMQDNMELFKQFNDSPKFKKWLSNMIFYVTYDPRGNCTRIATTN